jgi:hypothetical protein
MLTTKSMLSCASLSEFKQILQRNTDNHLDMSDEDIQELLETFDENEDGVLQISEFIDAMDMIEGEDVDEDDDQGAEEAAEAEAEEEEEKTPEKATPPSTSSAAFATGAFVKPEGWLGFELGMLNGREQLKAFAPIGTDVDEPMDGMITGKDADDNVLFVVSMAQADEDEAGVDGTALEAAVADFTDTYTGVTSVQKELLADGYVFTAQNEPEIGGTNYWVFCRRSFPSKGKAWNVEATAASAEQQTNAVAFAKSINDAPDE